MSVMFEIKVMVFEAEKLMIQEVRILNLVQINTLTRTFHVRDAFHVREAFHVRGAFRVRDAFHVRACGLRILLRAPSQDLPLHLPLPPQPSWSGGGAFPSSLPSFQA